ncbi:hypothetical protein ACQUFH_09870 [Lactococcus lactis]|uniref:hypothetical protein n=1 Tax=Lactococcus lactis TaxID=1358 RepID=UPI003D12956A
MSEQKYAVKCKLASNSRFIFGLNKREGYCSIEIYPGSNYNNPYFKTHFTKSELAEIMGGALYKKADYCEFMELTSDWEMNDENDKWLCEWINPLIELVPVEDGE